MMLSFCGLIYNGLRLSHLAVLMVALSCLSCSHNKQSYFPLSKGYKWHYDVTLITRDGLIHQKYILNNLGKSELNGKPVYLRRSLDGTILYYSMDDKGIVYLGWVSNLIPGLVFQDDEQIVLRNPIKVDTTWEQKTFTRLLKKTGPPQKTEFKIIAEVPLDVKIESLTETVHVPAGEFKDCMQITMKGSAMKDAGNYVGLTLVGVEQTSWYAKGVGLVKLERVETTQSNALDKGSLLVELTDFDKG